MVKSLLFRPDKHGRLAALFVAAAALTQVASAQLGPKSIAVSVAQSSGLLTGPDESVRFFQYNLAAADQWLVKRTNGIAWNLTLSGNAHVLSGSQVILDSGGELIGSPGSIVQLRNLKLLDATSGQGPEYAARHDYVDSADFLIQVALITTSPKILSNKAALVAELVPSLMGKFAYVKNNTGLDGAKGLWLWDYESTEAESAVILKSSNLSSGSPGRWFKMN